MPTGSENSAEDRTESASSFRREEFRRQGTVALSKDLLSVAGLLGVGGALYFAGGQVMTQFQGLAQSYFKFSKIDDLDKAGLLALRIPVITSWSWMVMPVFGTAVVVGILAAAAQVGFYITWEPLSPNWERLDPIAGFGRLFSSNGIVEALKAFVKLGVGGFILYSFMQSQIPVGALYLTKSIPEMVSLTSSTVSGLFFKLVGSLAVLGAADYGFQRYRLEKQMKMTKREAKEEYKLREGDPHIKAKIKSMQRRIASKRMMADVPKADVVVTNPTHLAVALKYDPGSMAAPKVIAKGADEVAKKIRELAKKSGVPLVENKPLARTLYKEIEVGHSVPRELYKAVAEVLAYVYRLRGGMGARA